MRYSKLIWNHEFADEPAQVFSEHDDGGWERRKVEVFPDGSVGFASSTESFGGTKLSLIQCPPDEEVNLDPEFKVVDVAKDEFEGLWNEARQGVRPLRVQGSSRTS
jgi:hypothetical protein